MYRYQLAVIPVVAGQDMHASLSREPIRNTRNTEQKMHASLFVLPGLQVFQQLENIICTIAYPYHLAYIPAVAEQNMHASISVTHGLYYRGFRTEYTRTLAYPYHRLVFP